VNKCQYRDNASVRRYKKRAAQRHAAEMAKVDLAWEEMRKGIDPANVGGFIWQGIEYSRSGEVWAKAAAKAACKPGRRRTKN
jgi:hypothetical protein